MKNWHNVDAGYLSSCLHCNNSCVTRTVMLINDFRYVLERGGMSKKYIFHGAAVNWSLNHYELYMDIYQNCRITSQIAKILGPTWVLSALDGPHVGPMSLAIRDVHATITRLLVTMEVTEYFFYVWDGRQCIFDTRKTIRLIFQLIEMVSWL